MRARLVLITIVAALVLVASAMAAGRSPSQPVLGRAQASAPCTKRALTAGLRRGKPRGRIPRNDFGCAGRFAFAAVVVAARNNAVEITVLFHAVAGHWAVASRGKYCEDGEVPAKIRQPACETN
jgi:hypothetical protein